MSIDRIKHSWKALSLVLLVLLMQGCGAAYKPGIWDADTITLYSLDGNVPLGSPDAPGAPVEKFHGWPVLGKVVVDKFDDQKKLRKALEAGIEGNKGMVAGCFIPRHGIRSLKGDRTVDLVICFECMSMQVHENGGVKQVLTTAKPQPVFDAYLTKMNIPLAQ